jgi:glycine cleavage system H protein
VTSYSDDRRYTKDHEWVRVQGEVGVVGITDYAQNQLGDVVYLDLPEVGRSLKANEQFGTVESVKAVSELFCPVSGEVVKVNADLVGKPETINSDPHGAGWMLELRLADPAELKGLMDAAAYAAFVASEAK